MATLENLPSSVGTVTLPVDAPDSVNPNSVNPLNQLLARVYTLDWTTIFYVALFATAILTRFVNLGDRVMSHDESLHTQFSYNLYKQGNFQHTPLMHGPVLFHAVAFFYFLFGDADYTARIYPALLGIIMVMMPRLLFQRWLGKYGAMVASVLLLISPMVLFHNRYIREDTPSIFYTLIMVYCFFRYVDGIKPRQVVWLLVLSGAMLLSLGSKEVAFMYIAIFGSFLTLYWLVQVIQGVRSGETQPIVGTILGGVLGVGIIGAVALLIGGALSDKLVASGIHIQHIVAQVAVLIVLGIGAYAFFRPGLKALRGVSEHANSTLQTLTIGIVMGTVAALVMICIVNIAQPKVAFNSADANSPAMLSHLLLWTALTVIVLLAAVLGTAVVAFARVRRLPWMEIISVVAIAFVVCTGLLYAEERSNPAANTSASASTDHAVAVDPNNPTAAAVTGHQDQYIVYAWIIGAAAILGILGLRFLTPFFEEMKRYPAFDLMIVMGTLLLPWLTAIPMFLAGYQLDVYPAAQEVITAGAQSAVPFVAVAIVAGLCWNPAVWIACAATFYSIFAFFYTTVFTNPPGIISGAIGSLGYWLAQQGVRRGSQPQYYYMLVELPVYEYLPVIGALLAGVGGLFGFWRFRAMRYLEAEQVAPLVVTSSYVEPPLPAADGATQTFAATAEMSQMPDLTPPLDAFAPLPHESLPGESLDNETSDNTEASFHTELIPELPAPAVRNAEWLDRLPFMGFVAYWGVLILYAFTVSGEKMPWLTMHLTVPFILITGFFLGKILEKVEWPSFFQRGWSLIILTPILVIALANVFGTYFTGQRPFAGLSKDQLLQTAGWLAALLVTFLVLYAINTVITKIGTRQTLRTMFLGVFVLLGVLTARTAWRFAYIDYDYATEFGVYAHGAPAMKTVMNKIEELSKQTTDGLNIKVAYDNDVSWPGSWYFRVYPNARFVGDTTSTTDFTSFAAIVVSVNHSTTIEPQLGDAYYKYNFIRLWWPMQDYFDLNPARIDNIFADDSTTPGDVKGSALRQGLWDIWWNRDYTAYASATNKKLDISQWPVADRMVFYVRKDIAAQVWDMGVGGATASAALPADAFAKLSCNTCAATMAFGSKGSATGQFDHPHGLSFAPNGDLYVADSQNTRISIFDPTGKQIGQFGTPGDTSKGEAPGGTFREPWSVAVGKDGMTYVADTWNHRVQVFDANHQFVRMWGHFEQVNNNQAGAVDGLWGPRDIVVDAQNHVYVADTGNKRIRVYDNMGKFLYNIGAPGAGQGQLNEPVGMVIDPKTEHLYVADTWNRRIEVFDLKGGFVSSWPVPAWNGPSDDTGNRPYLTLDQSGTRLFVTEPDIGRILVWDVSALTAQGGQQPLLAFGLKSAAVDLTHFDILGGLTTDANGNLYVADAGSGRILRFDISKLPGVLPSVPLVPLPATQQVTQDTSF